ncbi:MULTISPECIES: DUF3616 domain-containing protein [unclassified Pseudomonas]|uniref:DUF3616 domain-containing protein n=1 Tax=unclassified Pseudomonas TaxID=196821 RepID=UPI000DABB362|nr:DUF3616 domain-containing protein [Pseudomonas sp. URMO17WK12:I6]PZW64000.1 uncharacterized protein DUF3616 [Pseudomonas sp. URMO17WK12:I6]
MMKFGSALLVFNETDAHLRDGLSAVVQVGNTLWVANDESLSLERFTRRERASPGQFLFDQQKRFPLASLLTLPVMPDVGKEDVEADLEGMSYDRDTGYLWIVGSHSLKRKKPDSTKSLKKNAERLAIVSRDGNRFLLARIPLVEENGTFTLVKSTTSDDRVAAQLAGNQLGNELLDELKDDEHVGAFLHIPSKDNGFDTEGLEVNGKRVFIGLRGPVLRGWAIILEVEPEDHPKLAHTLRLKKIGPGGRKYRKHFFQLNGLGVRDLCLDGDDMLILAGPTMDLDGPVTVFRWRDGARPADEGFVFSEQLTSVLEVPYGQGEDKGCDHAEGMTFIGTEGVEEPLLLVVYDVNSDKRKQGSNGLEQDVFRLAKK